MKKFFWKTFLFLGGGKGVGIILFIPRTVSKHKIQLLPSKVCAILYLLKEKVANPHPLNKFPQNKIRLKKILENFKFLGVAGGVRRG